MSFDLLRNRITTNLQSALTAESITEPIEWPNIRFAQPESGVWMRASILPGTTNPTAIGDAGQRRRRTMVLLIVQVFTPEHAGTKRAHEIAEKLAKRLDYLSEGTNDAVYNTRLVLNWRTLGMTDLGVVNGFHQHNLQIEIQADMVSTA